MPFAGHLLPFHTSAVCPWRLLAACTVPLTSWRSCCSGHVGRVGKVVLCRLCSIVTSCSPLETADAPGRAVIVSGSVGFTES